MSGCIAAPAAQTYEDENDDPFYGTVTEELARSGRWTLPDDVRAAGEAQYVAYSGGDPWAGGANCTGGLLSGTRRLGEHLVASFRASSFDGYSCRQNTADTSKLSMHGTGRAIDVFVPLSGSSADNDEGDPIANWLVRNAELIGVQFIIWDRTKWNGSYSGRKDGSYGGPHPHHDHLHVELTAAGARGETPWFGGSGAADVGTDTGAGSGAGAGAGTATTYGECNGGAGTCIDVDHTTCAGTVLVGLCPHGSNIRCCVPGAGAPEPAPAPEPEPAPAPEPAPSSGGLCLDLCPWAADGECDDGGPGSLYDVCPWGTDCTDCGPR